MIKMLYNNNEVGKMRAFPVIYEQDKDGYFIVSCPVLEGCYSQGETLEKATENIKEAIGLCLEDMGDMNESHLPDNAIVSQVVIP